MKLGTYFEAEIRAYLHGAARKFGHPYKIGNTFKYIRVPGKNAKDDCWEGYFLFENPDLPSIQEIKKLLPDVHRLEREVSTLHSDVKRIPFPMDRSSLIPISMLSGPEWSSKGDKGFNKEVLFPRMAPMEEKVSVADILTLAQIMARVQITILIRKVPIPVDQVMERVREKVFMAADHNLEKTILIVVKDTLRIHVREIAAKEFRFYLLLRMRLLLLLLLQTGFIRLHCLSVDLILRKAM